MVAFNISNVASKNFANMFFNCYTMLQSGVDQTETWFNSFTDFTDVYTSFLFQLLANSLKLKSIATSLQTAQTGGDWVTFWKNIAQIIQIMFDFQSSSAASLEDLKDVDLSISDWMKIAQQFSSGKIDLEDKSQMQLMQKIVIASASALERTFPGFMKKPLNQEHQFVQFVEKGKKLYEQASQQYGVIQSNLKEQSSKARVNFDNKIKPASEHRVQASTTKKADYSFHFDDIFNLAFGLLEGATSAIPTSTYNYQCGKNVTNARLYSEASGTAFSSGDVTQGVSYVYKVLQITDDITINCWLGIKAAATISGSTLLTMDGIPTNILYNAGFMFTDVLNLVNYNVLSTDPYWYYFAFNLGDFMVRFIYKDSS